MKLIACLGNPGEAYSRTRHNIGFMIADVLADRWGASWGKGKLRADACRCWRHRERILLLKPLTFMNNSGESISQAARYYRIGPDDIIVVHDDLDLEFGHMKIRRNGSDGGHKGVRSSIEFLKSDRFSRVRMGIGKPDRGETAEEYVLRPFYTEQSEFLSRWVAIGADAVEALLRDGIEKAANQFNKKSWFEEPSVNHKQIGEVKPVERE